MLADIEIPRVTYSASILGLVAVAGAMDIFTITGSATKIIRVLAFEITATAGSGTVTQLVLLKRSTANTLGTSTTPTAIVHDSLDVAATAVVRAYTANPTLGTLVGNIKTLKIGAPATNQTSPGMVTLLPNGGDRLGKQWVLRGTSELLALNFNANTLNGNSFDINVVWTEE